LLALLELPQATLLDAQRLLVDYEYRQALVTVLADGPVKKFGSKSLSSIQRTFAQKRFLLSRTRSGSLSHTQSSARSLVKRKAALKCDG
jgi:hypothetical protein